MNSKQKGMQKTTRGKSNMDTRLGEEMEGGTAKPKQWSVGVQYNKYWAQTLWSERWTKLATWKLIRCRLMNPDVEGGRQSEGNTLFA